LPAGLGRQLADRASLASRYLRLREDGKYYLMLGYELLRQVALEVGRRLGIGEDVFFFTAEEMLAALRASPHIASGPLVSPLSAGQPPEGPTPPLPLPRANPSAAEQVCQQASERRGQQITEHVLAERKAAYHAEIRIPLPRFIDAAALETLGQPPPAPTGQQYRGFPLSPGAALGPARIVRSPAEAGRLGRRYVLVCHSTDPAWTPLFAHAAALVIECGGALSHGAIVAREMGLPAVVLPEATTIFTEGESLVVDGSTGLITRGTSGTVTANSLPSADDVRIAWRQLPPPPGPGERRGAKVRNLCLLCWGVYLLAALLLPTPWLYEPSLRTLDAVLWPVLRMLGKQGVVISAAAGLAAMTMLGQRLLSDNRRLREAKRRAAALVREANQLPPHAPRRRTLLAAAATVNARLFGAAMLPLAILLGPMVLMFLWFPARVDPASWNAPPGASVDVVAMIDGEFTGPVTLELTDPLRLDETTPAAQCLPPVATVLREMLAGEHKLPELPGWTPEQLRADLAEYLAAGVPPQSLAWKLHVPPTAEGRFAVSLRAGNQRPLRLFVVLGERYPPEPAERFSSAAGPVRSAKIIYPPPDERRVFWAPLGGLGLAEWDAGWLTLYLVVYLPAMLLFRWMLRIA
jgi:pyruvate,water dikinase